MVCLQGLQGDRSCLFQYNSQNQLSR